MQFFNKIRDEIELIPNDTFLYNVNELSLDEETVTNGIAKYIDENEKNDYKLRENVKDEFASENDNFLFKQDSDNDNSDNDFNEEYIYEGNIKNTQNYASNHGSKDKKENPDFLKFCKEKATNKLGKKKKKQAKEKVTVQILV